GFTTTFGLDGSMDGSGVARLQNEATQNRITLTDNTFDPTTFVPGDPRPVLQNLGVSSVLDDLGIAQSDANRRQTFGVAPTAIDPEAARTVTVDITRGPQLTVNVAAQVGRSLEQFASDFGVALRAAINAAGVQGYTAEVRVDSSSGELLVETTDSFNNAGITLSGADAAALGLDTASANVSTQSDVVFNFGTASYEGKHHTLSGRASDNIFTTINDLKNALGANATAGIAATLGSLERSISLLLDARGESGARVRRLDLADRRLTNENEHLDDLATGVMGIDLAEAATRLAQQENLFQAGIQATARISRISILDYI
ncbi:MAG: hypothetical protein KDB07_10380, partial [Planctomycetes bacterium]|nr:hypothetical protein [Planctomycetota bacterium]